MRTGKFIFNHLVYDTIAKPIFDGGLRAITWPVRTTGSIIKNALQTLRIQPLDIDDHGIEPFVYLSRETMNKRKLIVNQAAILEVNRLKLYVRVSTLPGLDKGIVGINRQTMERYGFSDGEAAHLRLSK